MIECASIFAIIRYNSTEMIIYAARKRLRSEGVKMAGNQPKKENIHAGHRKRMKAQFLKNGMANLEPHIVLELLLYYSIPQGDTNPLGHRLIDRFGSLSAVFDAPYEELIQVDGIGEQSAVLIKLIPELCRRYQEDREHGGERVFSSDEALRLVRPKFFGRKTEAVVLLLLDSRGKTLYCDIINEGSVNAAPIYANQIVRLVARYEASTAVLAHNHPSGQPMPTSGDISATRRIIWALDSLGVLLHDHLIVTDTDFLSMNGCGLLKTLYEEHMEEKDRRLYPESEQMVGDQPVYPIEDEEK